MTAPAWDLLIRGGTLIDPAQSISAKRDVAFRGGKVAAVAEKLIRLQILVGKTVKAPASCP